MIRPARAADADRLTAIALASKAHWGYSAEFMAACRAELTVTPADVRTLDIAVLETDQPIGFRALEWLDADRAELDALFLMPSCIGHGYGRMLMADAVAVAQARGVRTIVIQADPFALPFYERIGARRVGERPSASIVGRQLPLLELSLDRMPRRV